MTKLPFALLLLGLSAQALSGATSDTSTSTSLALFKRETEFDRRLATYENDQKCLDREGGDGNEWLEDCKEACGPREIPKDENGKPISQLSSISCDFSKSFWVDSRDGKPSDRVGTGRIRAGVCLCDDPVVNSLSYFVINGVAQGFQNFGKWLGELLCGALKIVDLFKDIALMAIPGPGQAIKALTASATLAIKAAKAYKYAYEGVENAQAANEFGTWFLSGGAEQADPLSFAGLAGCPGKPILPSLGDLISAFVPMVEYPDVQLPGGVPLDTVPGGKGGCMGKKPCNKKDDQPKSEKEPEKTAEKTQDNQPSETPKETGNATPTQTANPEPSATEAPSSSSSVRACKMRSKKARRGLDYAAPTSAPQQTTLATAIIS
ncbi:hypothetical protein BDV95DRAFT_575631 [Massariosphaeria phaeospora]|uniref:Uncharacterized protein n=1 Tax=Massariosphaeria phaeospora TaxID=100035 RepID=A0A7C8M6N9_9PLEO|nr:hypothetical protein BDV95DRAFT_575631 [Massariosphaeria phaeospora]